MSVRTRGRRSRAAMCSRAPCPLPRRPKLSGRRSARSRKGLWTFLVILCRAGRRGAGSGHRLRPAGRQFGWLRRRFRRRRSRCQQYRGYLPERCAHHPPGGHGPRSALLLRKSGGGEADYPAGLSAGKPRHGAGAHRPGRKGQCRHRGHPDGGRLYRHQRPCDRRRAERAGGAVQRRPLRGGTGGLQQHGGSGAAEGGERLRSAHCAPGRQ
nr:putative protein [uncultured bacterium]